MPSSWPRAEALARHIVTLPPAAVRMMKEFVIRFGNLPDDQAWHVQNLMNSLLIQTTMDGEEGRTAFNEKRPPNFTGTLRKRGEPWPEWSEDDAAPAGRGLSQRRVLTQTAVAADMSTRQSGACRQRTRPLTAAAQAVWVIWPSAASVSRERTLALMAASVAGGNAASVGFRAPVPVLAVQ